MEQIENSPFNEEMKLFIENGFHQQAISTKGCNPRQKPHGFFYKKNDTFIAILIAEIFWGGLYIKHLFIDEKYRSQDIGTKLMHKAFEYGKEHNCSFCFVDTLSFQALGFYQKLGFELEFTRNGYSHDVSFHYLRKNF